MNQVTLLNEDQVFGANRLKIFKTYDTKAPVTDFAILTGAYPASSFYAYDGASLADRTGYWWTKTIDSSDSTVVSVG